MRRCHAELHKRGEIYYFFFHDKQGKRQEESLRTTDLQLATDRHKTRMQEIQSGRSPNDLSHWSLQRLSHSGLIIENFVWHPALSRQKSP
jgi:hypothetical protein